MSRKKKYCLYLDNVSKAHGFYQNKKREIFGFGLNNFGQLGTGDSKNSIFPKPALEGLWGRVKKICTGQLYNEKSKLKMTKMECSEAISQVFNGFYHTFIIGISGKIYGFGEKFHFVDFFKVPSNFVSQSTIIRPVELKNFKRNSDVDNISLGYEHSIVSYKNGTVISLGTIFNKSFRRKKKSGKSKLILLDLNFSPIQIHCGESVVFMFDEHGRCHCGGHQSDGRLGRKHVSSKDAYIDILENKNIKDVLEVVSGNLTIFDVKKERLWNVIVICMS